MPNFKPIKGFTLIELIVAIMILSVIVSLISGGFYIVIKNYETMENRSVQLSKSQFAVLLLERDIQSIVNRDIIGQQGQRQPALLFESDENHLYIEFTRIGYINPLAAINHSSLQRVAYLYQNKQLLRITWPVLDQALTTEPTSRLLLDNISSLHMNFLNEKRQYVSNISPQAITGGIFPLAIQVNLVAGGVGEIDRIIPLSIATTQQAAEIAVQQGTP